MSLTEFHCTQSNDDQQVGDDPSTTVTIMFALFNNTTVMESQVRAHLDTSALGTDTITAATLYWYNDAASTKSPKAATYDHRISFVGGSEIYQNTSQIAAGWNSHALTAGELLSINTSGDTSFHFSVPDPGSTYARIWPIRAWDYSPNGDYSVYLEVTHAAAGGPTKMLIVGV